MHEKDRTIIVNGESRVVSEDELSFDQIVELAFGAIQRGPQIVFTVVYRRGEGDKPKGTLVEGQTVKVKDEMIFDVTRTDKS